MIKSKESTENYIWGNNCLGWRLVDTTDLSIIEEEMPPGTEEAFHHHARSNQFFFILEGTAFFQLDGKAFIVNPHEGLFVESGKVHKISNKTDNQLKFLVISNPTTRNDRHEEIE